MNQVRTHSRAIERGLLLAVLATQVVVFCQVRELLSDARAGRPVPSVARPEPPASPSSSVQFNLGWDRLRASPTLDMRHTESGYLVTFSIPGVHADDLGVLLDGRVLTVRAWCAAPGYPGGGQRYERRILLPGPVGAAEEAQAQLTNGLLRVHVPKGTGSDPRRMVLRLF